MKNKLTLLIFTILLLLVASPAWAQQGAPATVQILIDKTPPLTPTVTATPSGWTNQNVTVTFGNIQDNSGGSGVDHVSYSTDGGTTWQQLSGTYITLTNEGSYAVQAQTYDKVGHVSQTATTTAQIDKTPPMISVAGVADGQTYYAAVTPNYSASDSGGSGLGTVTATMTLNGSATAWSNGSAVSSGGSYVLTVTAPDNAGNVQTSVTHFSIAAPVVPGAPTITANSNCSLHVAWNAINGATGYKVYRDAGSTPVYDGAATSYDDSGLGTNTQHSYTVLAYNAVGPSAQSAASSAWTLASQPINLHVVSTTSNSITVAWDKVDNPAGTQFTASISGNGHNDSVAYTADMVTSTFNGLTSGTAYTVSVKVRNGAQVETTPVTLNVTSNTPPSVTITSPPAGQAFSDVSSYKTITVSGTVTDVDNDTCTVTATIAGVSHSQAVSSCAGGKPFSITFDVLSDNLPEGSQTVTVTADDGK